MTKLLETEKFFMNERAAIEWLQKSWHNLSSAEILLQARHYGDVIAVELHYGVEKALKALLAYQNQKIPKTHDLIQLCALSGFSCDNIEVLEAITDYHIEAAYPAFEKIEFDHDELSEQLLYAFELFDEICNFLHIESTKVKQ